MLTANMSAGSVEAGERMHGEPRPCVQQRARRHGNAGIHGNVGSVESVTYRIYRVLSSSIPTLSATNE
jgi:hypothetical protein